MTAVRYALVDSSGIVSNTVLIDGNDGSAVDGLRGLYAQQGITLVESNDAYIGGLYDGARFRPPQPGDRYVWDAESWQWVLACFLTANPPSIPADGTTSSEVTYKDESADPPAEVTFDINGVTSTQDVVDGVAQIAVTSKTSGDIVTVTCQGLSVQIGVE